VSKSNGQTDNGDWSSASDALFQAVRTDHDPTATDRARVRRALATRLGGGAPAALAVDGGAQAMARKGAHGATLGNIVKVSLGVACVVAVVSALMLAVGHPSERPAKTPLVAPAQSTTVTPAQSTTVTPAQSTTVAPRQMPTSASDSHAAPVKVALSDSKRSARAASRLPRAHVALAKMATSVSNAPAPSDSMFAAPYPAPAKLATPEGNAPTRSDSKVMPAAASPPDVPVALSQPSPAEPADRAAVRLEREPSRTNELADAGAELALVERIYAAMHNANPSAALALCAEHERRWPHGTFAQEREGVRSIAFCDMRSKQAGSRARAFLADHPRAPLAPRVAAACATQLTAATQDRAASGLHQ
jgi:hypothetical protein